MRAEQRDQVGSSDGTEPVAASGGPAATPSVPGSAARQIEDLFKGLRMHPVTASDPAAPEAPDAPAAAKPPATEESVDDNIGAKLRSIFGLDPKGKKPEIADSAQESSSPPGSSEVPGKKGLPDSKIPAEFRYDEDEEEDDE